LDADPGLNFWSARVPRLAFKKRVGGFGLYFWSEDAVLDRELLWLGSNPPSNSKRQGSCYIALCELSPSLATILGESDAAQPPSSTPRDLSALQYYLQALKLGYPSVVHAPASDNQRRGSTFALSWPTVDHDPVTIEDRRRVWATFGAPLVERKTASQVIVFNFVNELLSIVRFAAKPYVTNLYGFDRESIEERGTTITAAGAGGYFNQATTKFVAAYLAEAVLDHQGNTPYSLAHIWDTLCEHYRTAADLFPRTFWVRRACPTVSHG
jgi:hypothetical protein